MNNEKWAAMPTLESIFSDQKSKFAAAYETLQQVMVPFFFRSVGRRIGDLLPMVASLTPETGLRRTDFDGETFLVYLDPVGARRGRRELERFIPHPLTSAAIHRSSKPLIFDGRPYTLVVLHCASAAETAPECCVTLPELQRAFAARYGAGHEAAVRDVYGRIDFGAAADLDADRLAQRLHIALEAQDQDHICAAVEPWERHMCRLSVALSQPVPQRDIFLQLLEAVELAGFDIERIYLRPLLRGGDADDFTRMPVMVATVYLALRRGRKPSPAELDRLLRNVRMANYVPMDDLFHDELVLRHHFSLEEANLIRAIAEFIHDQMAYVNRSIYIYSEVVRYLALYPELAHRIARAFDARFNPGADPEAALDDPTSEIDLINSGSPEKDRIVRSVFHAAYDFVRNVRKTNFYSPDKAALAFRLDPAFMDYYRGLDETYIRSFPAETPFGVFYFFRRGASGYQVRFAEIARGGWRTVIPALSSNELEKFDVFDDARDELFREVFVLAHTQHLKNKDIYEGGSKMITLLRPVEPAWIQPALRQAQRSIFRAFLSLINCDETGKLRDPAILDRLGEREIIEIGPDENMSDAVISWMGDVALRAGYSLGSGIISGKPGAGINHKEYGVTSFGVLQYLLRTLQELGIDPARDSFSIKLSGGPTGDVAGNEIKLLLAKDEKGKPRYPGLKIVAITDGPAAAYDPDGLDRDELERLLFREPLSAFDPEKLSGEGAHLLYSQVKCENDREYHEIVVRRRGKSRREKIDRDDFMRRFQHNLTCYADVFIPAGGRPSTINEENVRDYFPEGKPSFRAIVEGANSFITPAARDYIQQQGVADVKDASANKCGVITSSYEILAGLMLNEEEFRAAKAELVPQVMEILERRAKREAEWLYQEHHATGEPLTRLTDRLSREINQMNDRIRAYLKQHPEFVTDALVKSHLPQLFSTRYADRPARLPAEYRRDVVSVELACRQVFAATASDPGEQLKALMTEQERAAMR